jgi:hypothetical protein
LCSFSGAQVTQQTINFKPHMCEIEIKKIQHENTRYYIKIEQVNEQNHQAENKP